MSHQSPPPARRATGYIAAVSDCLACGGPKTAPFIDAGSVPVQCTALFRDPDLARGAPAGELRLSLCHACGATTNRAFDPGLVVYDGEYENSQLFSGVFRAFAEELVDGLVERHDLRGRHVVEVGSGKGEFLTMLAERGANRAVGYDPSYRGEVDHLDDGLDVTFVREVFDEGTVGDPPDLVCCRHVLEHLSDPVAMLRSIHRAVRANPSCVLYLEVPNAEFTFTDAGVWDVIYQHCTYFSAVSLERAVRAAGFEVLDLRPSFAGQFLSLEAVATGSALADGDERVLLDAIDDELAGRVRATVGALEPFGSRHRDAVHQWRRRLGEWQASGRRIALWGAGAKGVTFLNLVGRDAVDVAVDVNPRKQGTYLPGTGHEVVGPDELVDRRPDVVVVMNALYQPEIVEALHERGLIPLVVAV
jgi:SAM-dependent methyltransferase